MKTIFFTMGMVLQNKSLLMTFVLNTYFISCDKNTVMLPMLPMYVAYILQLVG